MILSNEVTRGPPGGVRISHTIVPPLTSFKQLSKLDRLYTIEQKSMAQVVSMLAVVQIFPVPIPTVDRNIS